MMEYSEIFDNFEAYKTRMEAPFEEGLVHLPYADYGSGVFGVHVVQKPPGGPLDAARIAAELMELKSTSPLVVWKKFSRPLDAKQVLLPSLSALVAETQGKEGLFHHRGPGGVPASVDYSGAESGSSVIYTIPQPALASAGRSETIFAARRWPGLDWWFILGLVPAPDVGGNAPSWGELR